MESAISFQIAGQSSLGLMHHPKDAIDTGVLIVVGGPQYRIGSHRQFIQLSRFLATQGISSFRFDYRGMGDNVGKKATFEQIDTDISDAITAFMQNNSTIKKVVIWGLCDAASAALMYGFQDPRVNGLVLLNPWLENQQAKAKTMVKFYYLHRILSLTFWRRLFSGNVNVMKGVKEASVSISETVKSEQYQAQSYQERMRHGIENFSGRICLILSGNDLTAREFKQQIQDHSSWQVMSKSEHQNHYLRDADHTFSSIEYKNKVAEITGEFIKNIREFRNDNND